MIKIRVPGPKSAHFLRPPARTHWLPTVALLATVGSHGQVQFCWQEAHGERHAANHIGGAPQRRIAVQWQPRLEHERVVLAGSPSWAAPHRRAQLQVTRRRRRSTWACCAQPLSSSSSAPRRRRSPRRRGRRSPLGLPKDSYQSAKTEFPAWALAHTSKHTSISHNILR